MHRICPNRHCATSPSTSVTHRVPAKATSNTFWGCGVNMRAVKKSSPEELFSNQVDGKNYLGWILALIHVEKTGNFYWLPLLKKLPPSMVEGFEEVKNIFAEKVLMHCPPITHSDFEDGASGSSSSSSTAPAPVVGVASFLKGEVVTDLDLKDLRILQMVKSNSLCSPCKVYSYHFHIDPVIL